MDLSVFPDSSVHPDERSFTWLIILTVEGVKQIAAVLAHSALPAYYSGSLPRFLCHLETLAIPALRH